MWRLVTTQHRKQPEMRWLMRQSNKTDFLPISDYFKSSSGPGPQLHLWTFITIQANAHTEICRQAQVYWSFQTPDWKQKGTKSLLWGLEHCVCTRRSAKLSHWSILIVVLRHTFIFICESCQVCFWFRDLPVLFAVLEKHFGTSFLKSTLVNKRLLLKTPPCLCLPPCALFLCSCIMTAEF